MTTGEIVDARLRKLADETPSSSVMESLRGWISKNPELARNVMAKGAGGAGLGGLTGYLMGRPGDRLKSAVGGAAVGTGIGSAIGARDIFREESASPEPRTMENWTSQIEAGDEVGRDQMKLLREILSERLSNTKQGWF